MDPNDKKRRGADRTDRDLPFGGGGSRARFPRPNPRIPQARQDDPPKPNGRSEYARSGQTRVPLGSTKKRPGDPGTLPFDYPVGHRLFRPKEFTSHNVILPNPQLSSAKLLATAHFEQNEIAQRASVGARTSDRKVVPANLLADDHPAWADVVGREIEKVKTKAARARLGVDSWGLDRSAVQPKPAKRKAKPAVSDQWGFDSPLPYARLNEKSRLGAIKWVRGAFENRRISQAVAVVVLILFISSLSLPSQGLFIDSMKRELVGAINSVAQPIQHRAAFFIVDDFADGLENWQARSGRLTEQASAGLTASGDMFLRDDTLRFSSYRLDLNAKIQSGAVGWVVRAQDFENYYGFKLVESTRRRKAGFHLERFAMVAGTRDSSTTRIELPPDLAKPGAFNKISVRVRDDQITTLVNGWGVDFWRDSRLAAGGVGLFADRGEVALVNQFTLTGNDDPWGLILYGTVETLRSVRDRLSSPAVIVFSPVPAQYVAAR